MSMPSSEVQPTSPRREVFEEEPGTKVDIGHVESAEKGDAGTYAESEAARLPKAHQDYLLERHGTLDLDPIPDMSPADPYNWPEWKVCSSIPATRSTITSQQEIKDRSARGSRMETDAPGV